MDQLLRLDRLGPARAQPGEGRVEVGLGVGNLLGRTDREFELGGEPGRPPELIPQVVGEVFGVVAVDLGGGQLLLRAQNVQSRHAARQEARLGELGQPPRALHLVGGQANGLLLAGQAQVELVDEQHRAPPEDLESAAPGCRPPASRRAAAPALTAGSAPRRSGCVSLSE